MHRPSVRTFAATLALAAVASLASLGPTRAALASAGRWATFLSVSAGAILGGLAVAVLLELRRLDGLAHRDPLTSALNRRGLARALAEAREHHGLILVDLDHFKALNDRYGHAAGDRALIEVARVLGEYGVAARLGGDELAVLVERPLPSVCAAIRQGIRARGVAIDLPLSASVGATEVGAGELTSVLERADRAMYEDKRACRSVTIARTPRREQRARRHVHFALAA